MTVEDPEDTEDIKDPKDLEGLKRPCGSVKIILKYFVLVNTTLSVHILLSDFKIYTS